MTTRFEEKVKNCQALTDDDKETLIHIGAHLPEATVAFLSEQIDSDPKEIALFVQSFKDKREALQNGNISELNSILEEENQ